MTLDLLPTDASAEMDESPAHLIPGDDPSALTLARQSPTSTPRGTCSATTAAARQRTRCGSRMAGRPCLRTT